MGFSYLASLVILICAVSLLYVGPSFVWAIPSTLKLQDTGAKTDHAKEGIALLNKGDSMGAEDAFRKSLNANTRNVAALVGLAEAVHQQGRYEEAQEKLQQALSLQPTNGTIQQAWGRFLLRRKEFKKAEAAYLRAIQLVPKNASAHIDLGDLYLGGLNQPKEAVRSFKAATKLAPNDGNAHFGLGISLVMMKKTKEALVELHEAAKLSPKNPIIYGAIGNVHRDQKRYDRALEAYASALSIAPRYVEAAMAKGDILSAQGHLGEAIETYKAIIEFAPNQANAYNNLAWIAAEQKIELDDAMIWAKKAVLLGPSVVTFKDTMAWVHRARGDFRQSIDTLKAALAMAPDHPTMTYHLGIVQADQGNVREAVALLKKATRLRLDPALSKDAQLRIGKLSSVRLSP